MIRRSILLALSTFAVAGCAVKTDLGKECILVRKDPSDPAGKKSIPILEGDIKPNKDFLSFGAVECEDLVCVRDLAFTRAAAATDPAIGYCSRPCLETSTTGCPAANEEDDRDPNKKLSCRPLILDETTLAAICQNDAVTCKRYFGDTTSPFFCARGAPKPDGGS
jgi:hypothetical protein